MPLFTVNLTFKGSFQLNEIQAESKTKAEQFVLDTLQSRLNLTNLSYELEYDSEEIDTDDHQFETTELDEEE